MFKRRNDILAKRRPDSFKCQVFEVPDTTALIGLVSINSGARRGGRSPKRQLLSDTMISKPMRNTERTAEEQALATGLIAGVKNILH